MFVWLPVFNDKMQNMPASASLLKKRFCRGGNANYTRHMVLAGGS
jgi:hypothetical protein